MKIAVLSGKGGTGKTLLSVNLAAVARQSIYIDCDVEEPNGYLFLKPKDIKSKKVSVKIPRVDEDLCNGCRLCVEFCKYNALAYINNKIMVFEEICHSCGGCVFLCPQQAFSEKDKTIGDVQKGESENVTVFTGILNTGEASGVPIIKELFRGDLMGKEIVMIDCPPGSGCTVMESIKEANYCILVAEPTLFGVHNLAMVYELVKLFKKPCGVVLNKCVEGTNPARDFCEKEEIKILGSIPFDNELGSLNSNGLTIVREEEKYRSLFELLLQEITKEVAYETIINSQW